MESIRPARRHTHATSEYFRPQLPWHVENLSQAAYRNMTAPVITAQSQRDSFISFPLLTKTFLRLLLSAAPNEIFLFEGTILRLLAFFLRNPRESQKERRKLFSNFPSKYDEEEVELPLRRNFSILCLSKMNFARVSMKLVDSFVFVI